MTRSNVRTQGWDKYSITIAFGSFAADGDACRGPGRIDEGHVREHNVDDDESGAPSRKGHSNCYQISY
jgi:hypothetical protein